MQKIIDGYYKFRKKYVEQDLSIMEMLSTYGQNPHTLVVACCDSRVDPALIFQCDPGDLFVIRNVANIVPPYEKDSVHHGTSSALEFGIKFLGIRHLVLLGHSQCGGINALVNNDNSEDDFITNWVSIIKTTRTSCKKVDDYAKLALKQSYNNCMTFPWIKELVMKGELEINQWFFDIKSGQIFEFNNKSSKYQPLV